MPAVLTLYYRLALTCASTSYVRRERCGHRLPTRSPPCKCVSAASPLRPRSFRVVTVLLPFAGSSGHQSATTRGLDAVRSSQSPPLFSDPGEEEEVSNSALGGSSQQTIYPACSPSDFLTQGSYTKQWNNRFDLYRQCFRSVQNVKGDGACFKHAIIRCLMVDFQPPLLMNMDLLNHQILQELESRWDFYLPFYNTTQEGEEGDEAEILFTPGPEDLRHAVLQYLTDNKWNADIMDIIVQATANALKMQIGVFSRSVDSTVRLAVVGPPTAQKRIFLELDCGHYKSVIKKDVYFDVQSVPKADSDYYLSQLGCSDVKVPPPGQTKTLHLVHDVDISKDTSVSEAEKRMKTDSYVSISTPNVTATHNVSDTQPEVFPAQSGSSTHAEEDFPFDPSHPVQMVDKSSRAYFPFELYKFKAAEEVESCPKAINGFCYFKINLPEGCNKNALVSDSRRFRLRCSRSKELDRLGATRKVGWCSGSLICKNEDCPFFRMSTERNTNNWDKGIQHKKGGKHCFSCGVEAFEQDCYGRKAVEFYSDYALVYHINWHTCSLRRPRGEHDEYLEEVSRNHPGLSAGEATMEDCMEALRKNDVDEMYRRAEILSDTTRMRYIQQKQRNENHPFGKESVEALLEFAAQCKKRDPFLMFKHNFLASDNIPCYVFKTSKEALSLAADMDIDREGDSPMKSEEAYFDGQHSRCKGYVTLALYTCIPAMRKIFCLARMECHSESSATIHLFFHFLNLGIQQVTGNPHAFFNPVKIISDAHSANENGIQDCYGEQYRRDKQIGCQKHYQDNVMKYAAMIPIQYREYFKKMSFAAMHSTSNAEYHKSLKELQRMATMFPAIEEHVHWWDVRRYHHVDFFRGVQFKSTNQAEAGHASFHSRSPLWLVEACQQDVCKLAVQGFQIKRFLTGQIPSDGRGPSQESMRIKDHQAQRRVASGMTNIWKRLQEYEDKEASKTISSSPPDIGTVEMEEEDIILLEQELDGQEGNTFTAPLREKHRPGGKGKEVKGKKNLKRSSATAFLDQKSQIEAILLQAEQNTSASDIAGRSIPDDQVKNPSRNPTKPEHRRYLRPNVGTICPFPLEMSVHENPPTLLPLSTAKARKCLSCSRTWLPQERKRAPTNMCFKLFCHRPWRNTRGVIEDKVVPGYFHCTMACLKTWDSRITEHDVVVPHDTLKLCNKENLEYFQAQGYLDTIYNKSF